LFLSSISERLVDAGSVQPTNRQSAAKTNKVHLTPLSPPVEVQKADVSIVSPDYHSRWANTILCLSSANISTNRRSLKLRARQAKPRSVRDPQQVLPLPEVTLESHALGNLKCRDHAAFDLLAGLSSAIAS
jgi:hypothetical protein